MKTKEYLVPVKKVLGMINACQTEEQLINAQKVVVNYLKSAKKHKIVNVDDLKCRLDEELLQRQEALYLVKIFNV
jgi:hypothetical protein